MFELINAKHSFLCDLVSVEGNGAESRCSQTLITHHNSSPASFNTTLMRSTDMFPEIFHPSP